MKRKETDLPNLHEDMFQQLIFRDVIWPRQLAFILMPHDMNPVGDLPKGHPTN